jgi:hypothetical protein
VTVAREVGFALGEDGFALLERLLQLGPAALELRMRVAQAGLRGAERRLTLVEPPGLRDEVGLPVAHDALPAGHCGVALRGGQLTRGETSLGLLTDCLEGGTLTLEGALALGDGGRHGGDPQLGLRAVALDGLELGHPGAGVDAQLLDARVLGDDLRALLDQLLAMALELVVGFTDQSFPLGELRSPGIELPLALEVLRAGGGEDALADGALVLEGCLELGERVGPGGGLGGGLDRLCGLVGRAVWEECLDHAGEEAGHAESLRRLLEIHSIEWAA